MRSLKHRTILYLCAVLFLAIAMVGTTTNAFASLSETGPATVSAGAVTLNGSNQTTTYALGLTVANTPSGGNTAGWKLTITSTTFTAGAHTLSTAASTIQTAPVVACNSNCSTNPTNSVTYPLTVPAASPAPTAVKFFNAAANTGQNNGGGSFLITPTITVAIPANTFAGSYTSTVTITIASGP